MGGVIVDVHRDRAIRIFMDIGVSDIEQFLDVYCHKGIFYDFENGDIDTDEFCRLLCKHTGKSIPREAIERAWKSMIDPPLAYKLEYLRDLRAKGYKVLLLTNNNPVIIGWACSPGFTPYGNALSDYFDKLYISYQMKCSKPGLEIYQKMIDDAGIDPAESLFIDDSDRNIQAAVACGLHVLLIQNGSDWRNTLTKYMPNIT